jgi:hypothetical protein
MMTIFAFNAYLLYRLKEFQQTFCTSTMSGDIGKWLIGLGLILALAGVVLWLFSDRLGWLGQLPGDIRIERENVRFYFPLSTMIIVSIVLSLLLTFLVRIFGR